jgi:hypothetical protein
MNGDGVASTRGRGHPAKGNRFICNRVGSGLRFYDPNSIKKLLFDAWRKG